MTSSRASMTGCVLKKNVLHGVMPGTLVPMAHCFTCQPMLIAFLRCPPSNQRGQCALVQILLYLCLDRFISLIECMLSPRFNIFIVYGGSPHISWLASQRSGMNSLHDSETPTRRTDAVILTAIITKNTFSLLTYLMLTC